MFDPLQEVERNVKNQQQHHMSAPLYPLITSSTLHSPQQILSQYTQQNAHLQHSGELELPVSQKPAQVQMDLFHTAKAHRTDTGRQMEVAAQKDNNLSSFVHT